MTDEQAQPAAGTGAGGDGGLPTPTSERHRRHRPAGSGRNRSFRVTYDDAETARIVEAANRAGLTPTGYVAAAALAAADGTRPPLRSPAAAALVELAAANTQVRRIGTNLNQLVTVANATGQLPTHLDEALRIVLAAVGRVDAAADRAARRIP